MVNTNYTEGRDELLIKVHERDALLSHVHTKITDFFVFPGPESRKGLLDACCAIREVLGIGYDWGDEG